MAQPGNHSQIGINRYERPSIWGAPRERAGRHPRWLGGLGRLERAQRPAEARVPRLGAAPPNQRDTGRRATPASTSKNNIQTIHYKYLCNCLLKTYQPGARPKNPEKYFFVRIPYYICRGNNATLFKTILSWQNQFFITQDVPCA